MEREQRRQSQQQQREQQQQRRAPSFPRTLSIVVLRSMMKRLGKQVLFLLYISVLFTRKTILQMIANFGR